MITKLETMMIAAVTAAIRRTSLHQKADSRSRGEGSSALDVWATPTDSVGSVCPVDKLFKLVALSVFF